MHVPATHAPQTCEHRSCKKSVSPGLIKCWILDKPPICCNMPLKARGMVQSAPSHVEEVIPACRWLEHHLQVSAASQKKKPYQKRGHLSVYLYLGWNFQPQASHSNFRRRGRKIQSWHDIKLDPASCRFRGTTTCTSLPLFLSLYPCLQRIRTNMEVLDAGQRRTIR